MNGRTVAESLQGDRAARRPRLPRWLEPRIAVALLVGADLAVLAGVLVAAPDVVVLCLWGEAVANGLLLVCFRRSRKIGAWLLVAAFAVAFLGYLALVGLAEGLRDA